MTETNKDWLEWQKKVIREEYGLAASQGGANEAGQTESKDH